MKRLLQKSLLVLLVAAGTVSAATFNLFSPANGVLKGNAGTYVTTSATATDVKSLWTGTCDDTTYLRGDGSCQTPPGTGGGTVNSVSLSAPSIFSVSGSPVTTTGTLGLTFATGQTANQVLATPDGTTGAVGLRALVSGDLPTVPASKGGTGVTTLTGLVKGNGTSAFTSAVAADVYGLWTGTCNSSSFLRGDGSCASPGVGTVTSVALTVPSGFSVTGSPITSSGTLAISGTLNPAAGGTGVATLTGIAKGNGTSAFTAAVSSDVRGLWGGTCDATTYLRGDGACATPPTGGTSANPSATIGLTAVNGSAGTFLRSDGAPALSQSIAPTWTAQHKFTSSGYGASAAIALEATAPVFEMRNSSQGTNAKTWLLSPAGTNQFLLQAENDAASDARTALAINRSGYSITSLSFGNATDNPTHNFLGTGVATFSGPVRAVSSGPTIWALDSGTNGALAEIGATNSASFLNFTYGTTDVPGSIRKSGTEVIGISTNRNVTIAAPASGTALAVSGNVTATGTVATSGGYINTANGITQVGSADGSGAYHEVQGASSWRLLTNSGTRLTVGSAGNVTVNAPASGTTLTTAALAGQSGVAINSASTTTGRDISVQRTSSTANAVESGSNIHLVDTGANTHSLLQQSGGQTELWQYNGSWAQVVKISSSGAMTANGSGLTSLNGSNVSSGTVAATNGGTGQSSYTTGDILYASSSTALSKLAAGTSGQVLTSNGAGVAPSYQFPFRYVGARCSSTSSGSCVTNSSLGATISFTSRSTGTVNASFTGFTSTPTCTATSTRGASLTAVTEIPTLNSTNIVITTRDSGSYSLNDQEFYLLCMGV